MDAGAGWNRARVALWLLWALSVFAACFATFAGVYVWLIHCPGAAELSPQRARCDALGDEGGTIALSVALAVATGLSLFMLLRSGHAASGAKALLVGALVLPPLLPVMTFAALSAPDDYCTPEQVRAEPPEACSAFEGDF